MIWLSWFFLIVEPISALMLAFLVLRHRRGDFMGILLRFWMAAGAAGLILHAGGQIELLQNYRPPRTLAWVPLQLGINGAIWTVFLSQWIQNFSHNRQRPKDERRLFTQAHVETEGKG